MEMEIRDVLAGLPPDVRELVAALRRVVRRVVPGAEESLLWGGISYHRPNLGGRVKGAICLIGAKKGQVRLDFIHGIRLADPASLLQGKLKSKRYVPIASLEVVDRTEIADLIRQAAAIEFPSSTSDAIATRIRPG